MFGAVLAVMLLGQASLAGLLDREDGCGDECPDGEKSDDECPPFCGDCQGCAACAHPVGVFVASVRSVAPASRVSREVSCDPEPERPEPGEILVVPRAV